MKYYAMWHPTFHWGPRDVPVLLRHKLDAVKGTGLKLSKMRELGWRWIVIEVKEPWNADDVDGSERAELDEDAEADGGTTH